MLIVYKKIIILLLGSAIIIVIVMIVDDLGLENTRRIFNIRTDVLAFDFSLILKEKVFSLNCISWIYRADAAFERKNLSMLYRLFRTLKLNFKFGLG